MQNPNTRNTIIQTRVNANELHQILKKMYATIKRDNIGEYIRVACLNYVPPKKPAAKGAK